MCEILGSIPSTKINKQTTIIYKYQLIGKKSGARGMVQVIEHLSSKCKVLSSNSTVAKKKKEKKREGKRNLNTSLCHLCTYGQGGWSCHSTNMAVTVQWYTCG
jgi:hypothetical protein